MDCHAGSDEVRNGPCGGLAISDVGLDSSMVSVILDQAHYILFAQEKIIIECIT
ncbi:unnamed protein product, partial [Vitis vinifera]